MRAVIALPYAWLAVFFLLPFALVLGIALGTNAPDSVPPVELGFSLDNFRLLLSDKLYLSVWLSSLRIAAASTLVALLLGYPMAYAVARAAPRLRPTLLMLIVLPFWTSFLIRVYAWIGLLAENGTLNQFLRWSGLASDPGTILGTEWAVLLGIVYAYLPFMVLPIYASLEKLDTGLLEAAADLGATPFTAFLTVTLPLIAPAVAAGWLLAFTLSLDDLIMTQFVAGGQSQTLPMLVYSSVRLGVDPQINVLATVIVAIAATALIISGRLSRQR